MQVRSIIFDIYGTLLEVGPGPSDADARWAELWQEFLQAPPRMNRLAFSVACSHVLARQHAASRARGIPWPEICWPSVVSEVLPELAEVTPERKEEFIFRQIQTGHTTRFNPFAAEAVRELVKREYVLGIASNAQAYTIREFHSALGAHGLDPAIFKSELCFWSYQHGFSKPDPHVFQILSARLRSQGIAENEILMVGDRLDNDIEPARHHGWNAWQVVAGHQGEDSGWPQLMENLKTN